MKNDQELVAIPGFGFYSTTEWEIYGPMRRGNRTDEEVCRVIGDNWDLQHLEDSGEYCRPQWDGVASCIPSAPLNNSAVLPCIEFFHGSEGLQFFDTSYNISKKCLTDGTWDNYTDYKSCLDHPCCHCGGEVADWQIYIWILGYSVSIISLLFAIFIFLYFREMKCLRHKIHLNLFLSVLTANLDWVLSYAVQGSIINVEEENIRNWLSTLNCILHVLLRYFHLTNFFWMFVEGAPLILTLIWTLLVYCNNQSEVVLASQDRNIKLVNASLLGCPFISDTEQSKNLELWAYTLPVCLLLACNFVFSIWIMAVVISKLRSNDSQHNTQNINLRAAKALIIIVPLLGITYLVTIVGPNYSCSAFATIFIIIRNVLLSFQGFFITLPYCFLNGEVCTMIKRHWDGWRDTNNIGYGPNSARNSIAMQGMYNVCDNITRKRSSHGYHTVTTVTNIEDRRGTQDTDLSNLSCKARKTSGSPRTVQAKAWRSMDGPLVPQPDLVQHTNSRAQTRTLSNQ